MFKSDLWMIEKIDDRNISMTYWVAHFKYTKDKYNIVLNIDNRIINKCYTIIYSCLCGSHLESVQEGNGENDI